MVALSPVGGLPKFIGVVVWRKQEHTDDELKGRGGPKKTILTLWCINAAGLASPLPSEKGSEMDISKREIVDLDEEEGCVLGGGVVTAPPSSAPADSRDSDSTGPQLAPSLAKSCSATAEFDGSEMELTVICNVSSTWREWQALHALLYKTGDTKFPTGISENLKATLFFSEPAAAMPFAGGPRYQAPVAVSSAQAMSAKAITLQKQWEKRERYIATLSNAGNVNDSQRRALR